MGTISLAKMPPEAVDPRKIPYKSIFLCGGFLGNRCILRVQVENERTYALRWLVGRIGDDSHGRGEQA
jgi:hypothetical protein